MTTYFIAAGVAPDKHRRDIRGTTGRIDADVQEADARLSQQRHNRTGMPGHIGHFRGDGLLAITRIQRPGQAQAEAE